MIYLKWFFLTLVDMTIVATPLAIALPLYLLGFEYWYLFIIPVWNIGSSITSVFTKPMEDGLDLNWGWGFGTYDNPPQGDIKHQREGLFPGALTGFKGYAMRVLWLWRNPNYMFQRKASITTPYKRRVLHWGNPDISDKYKIAGWYFATMSNGVNDVKAWEFYCVMPYWKNSAKCFRLRLGWKVLTDKIDRLGYAPLVNTIHIFKSYGTG